MNDSSNEFDYSEEVTTELGGSEELQSVQARAERRYIEGIGEVDLDDPAVLQLIETDSTMFDNAVEFANRLVHREPQKSSVLMELSKGSILKGLKSILGTMTEYSKKQITKKEQEEILMLQKIHLKQDFERILIARCNELRFIEDFKQDDKSAFFETHDDLKDQITGGNLVLPPQNQEYFGFYVDYRQIGNYYNGKVGSDRTKSMVSRLHLSENDLNERMVAMRHVCPETAGLLMNVAIKFQNKLIDSDLPLIHLKISGLSRTQEYQQIVSSGNSNAAMDDSNHVTGHAFDIAFSSFRTDVDGNEIPLEVQEMYKQILQELLAEKQIEDENEVIFYREGGCFHVSIGPKACFKYENVYNKLNKTTVHI